MIFSSAALLRLSVASRPSSPLSSARLTYLYLSVGHFSFLLLPTELISRLTRSHTEREIRKPMPTWLTHVWKVFVIIIPICLWINSFSPCHQRHGYSFEKWQKGFSPFRSIIICRCSTEQMRRHSMIDIIRHLENSLEKLTIWRVFWQW